MNISVEQIEFFSILFIGYGFLLWISILVWATRDAINRSHSHIFQFIAIGLNVFLPVLGLIIYLIIRPSKSLIDVFYEDLERRHMGEVINTCPHCKNLLHSKGHFCNHCGDALLKKCEVCSSEQDITVKFCGECAHEFQS